MWHTLENANGCGLAAPQINIPSRIFIVDSKTSFDNMNPEEQGLYFKNDKGIREVFINAEITEYSIEKWDDNEGCFKYTRNVGNRISLSYGKKIKYLDAKFQKHSREFDGLTARMIQHEFDHIEGKIYLEYLSTLKMTLIENKLNRIRRGKFKEKYPINQKNKTLVGNTISMKSKTTVTLLSEA